MTAATEGEHAPDQPWLDEITEQGVAALRETVPVTGLAAFFDRAYGQIEHVLTEQGRHVTDAPYARFYSRPDFTDPQSTIDVEAGWPVDGVITDADGVIAGVLPAGRVVRMRHVGSYDGLSAAWERLMGFVAERGLSVGEGVWERYLVEPGTVEADAVVTELVVVLE